jgi:hypothetical protein
VQRARACGWRGARACVRRLMGRARARVLSRASVAVGAARPRDVALRFVALSCGRACSCAQLGEGRLKFAWRSTGAQGGAEAKAVAMATASIKSNNLIVYLLRRDGSVYNHHTLGTGRCLWLEWDSAGATLGILQEGAGIFLWDLPPDEAATTLTVPMSLAPSITTNASFCKWSKKAPQLAIGTHQGKVIIFNKGEGVMQLHEKKGKHGSPVTCGDWLFDNRLGLASGLRVKISQPIQETGSKWESYSKFRLGGMLSKVPRHIRVAGDPSRLAFTLNYPVQPPPHRPHARAASSASSASCARALGCARRPPPRCALAVLLVAGRSAPAPLRVSAA